MKTTLLKKSIVAAFMGAVTIVQSSAQDRYVDELFTDVNVTSGSYGKGIYIFSPNVEDASILLQGPSIENPVTGDLSMDVYSPVGDTLLDGSNVTDRAAVIVMHTGNFLPRYFNQSTTGSRLDSSVVTLCTMLAKRGYVAMAINYRLGWNPLSPDPNVRRSTILNAVYRGLHDTKTAVRYLKSSVDDGNQYGIDPNKISVFGFGTGGYLASNYAALDRIEELQIQKFTDPGTGQLFVDTAIVGNIDGSGGSPAFNYVNHTGYCNEVMAAINAGGAMGDSTWIESGEIPMISFHCPEDPFAPFDEGIVVVPTTGEDVVQVRGSKYIIQKANELGNNDVMSGPYTDSYSAAAEQALQSIGLTPSNYQGLFPFIRPTIEPGREEASPWDFWSPAAVEATIDGLNLIAGPDNQLNAQEILDGSLENNPDMSPAKGKAYLDSIVSYMSYRLVDIMATAQEPANCDGVANNGTGINEFLETNTFVYPNPANDFLVVKTKEGIRITDVEFYDITGALVRTENGLNKFSHQINGVNNLPTGLYLVKVTTDQGVTTRKVMLK